MKTSVWRLLGVIWAVSVSTSACGAGGRQEGAGGRQELTQAEIEGELQSVNSRLRVLVDGLERSIPASDPSVFNTALRSDWLLDRATTLAASPADAELRTAFQDGTRESWRQRGLAADYLGMHFRFLRVHTLGGRGGLLFRASGERGSLNFCLFSIARDDSGLCAIDDVYVVGLCEFVSETLKRGFSTLVDSLDSSGDAGRRAAVYIEHLPKVVAVNNALREKDFPKVLALSDGLPASVRADRGLLLMRIEAAEHVSLSDRSRIMAEWLSQCPDENGLPLKFADLHVANGRWVEAERLLRTLDEKLGGDSHLKLRVGEIRLLQRRADRLAGERTGPPVDVPVTAGKNG